VSPEQPPVPTGEGDGTSQEGVDGNPEETPEEPVPPLEPEPAPESPPETEAG
jgi:hypothetical protein